MTVLNLENDGLPSILLTLASTVFREKKISREDLIEACVPLSQSDQDGDKRKNLSSRASGTLLRWTALGLFTEEGGKIRFTVEPKRGESPEIFMEQLPSTADLCRGLAWCFCQDIYTLPTHFTELEKLCNAQVKTGRFIFINSTRWPGLQNWARFFGFASGYDSGFIFDPTVAVRSELKEFLTIGEQINANELIKQIARRLPVLDTGSYRRETEEILQPEKWGEPAVGNLSTALSFALRRLQTQGFLRLELLSDASSTRTLMRQDGRVWESFTHVRLLKELP
jgi:hypothetical protein